MKKLNIVMLALTACGVVSCTQQKPTMQGTGADSLETALCQRIATDSTGNYAICVAFPVENQMNALLANSIREWVSEQLGGTYGDSLIGDYTQLLADTTALMSHYFNRIVKTNADEFAEMMLYNPQAKDLQLSFLDSVNISKTAEGTNWVTFVETREVYTGGAHGGHTVFGQTFRKSDGRRMGWDLLRNTYDEEFQTLLKAGLMEYWDLKNEAQLEDYLMGQANIYYIPLPQCPPLFTSEGISFVYNQYEIAAYASGLPCFTVSYDKLQPFLNATAHRLVDAEAKK